MTDHPADDGSTPGTGPEPNTRPGPTDEGGHGGMATRGQEARERRKRAGGEPAGDAPS